MTSLFGRKSEFKYVAVQQNEHANQPCTSNSEVCSDARDFKDTSVEYHGMNDLDADGCPEDTSSTIGLSDLDTNVGFWSRSSNKYRSLRWFHGYWPAWKRKFTRLELILTFVTATLALALAIGFSVLLQPDDVCTSRSCVEVASMVASAMDETQNPCDDFYKFSCGGWESKNPLPAGHAHWSMFNIQSNNIKAGLKSLLEKEIQRSAVNSSERKAKVLFNSCLNLTAINELGAEPLKKLVDEIGGWSISGPWNESSFDLNQILRRVFPHSVMPFFSFTVGTDLNHVESNIIKVGEGAISLGTPKFYINKTLDDEILSAFHEFMTEVCVLLGGDKNKSSVAMRNVLLFEQQLSYVKMSAEEARIADKYYKQVKVSELQKISPIFHWLEFVDEMFTQVLGDDKINSSELIGTMSEKYLRNLSQIVSNTSAEVLNNYIIWHVVSMHMTSLGQDFLDARNKINKVLYGSDMSCIERWRSCVSTVDAALGLTLGKMYVETKFDNNSKTQAEQMVSEIKSAFKRNLPKTTWMDVATRDKALEKIDAVQNMIGFPDYILNQTRVDEEYMDFEFTEDNTYFEIMCTFYKYAWKKSLEDLRKPVDKEEWDMTPPTINAYYTPTKNTIAFPAGILQPPAYSSSYPQSVNFGGIGIVVGHELSHGFDDQGRKYDKDGNRYNWWKNETAQKFREKTECMVKQYSKYSVRGHQVNGNVTLGENIADNGGLRLAYDAYMKWRETGDIMKYDPRLPSLPYTYKQLFFISFAQLWCTVSTPEYDRDNIITNVHSPFSVRVIGTLSNSPEFAEAFQCPSGSRMNPAHKCKVW